MHGCLKCPELLRETYGCCHANRCVECLWGANPKSLEWLRVYGPGSPALLSRIARSIVVRTRRQPSERESPRFAAA
jgi:hypothetical protein